MNCNHIRNPFTESFFKRQTELLENLKLKVAYADNEIPSWFSFQEVGSSISFQLPLYKRHDSKLEILVLTLWLVWEPTSKYQHYFDSDFTDLLRCQCRNNGSCMLKPNGATSSICYLTLDSLASLGMVDKREIEVAKNLKIDLINVDDAISVKKYEAPDGSKRQEIARRRSKRQEIARRRSKLQEAVVKRQGRRSKLL
nr:TMV resistance protein N-like [Ipomoea batatas]